jgi:hypothetical protein
MLVATRRTTLRRSVLGLLVAMTFGATAEARVVGGANFPEQIEAQGRVLALSGAALQKRLWFELYSIGLYMEQPAPSAEAVLDAEQVKQIQMHILRNLPADHVRKALHDGFRRSAGRQFAHLLPRLQQMLGAIQNVNKGERIVLTWVPGEGTHMASSSGPTLLIPGEDFARTLFSIWLGRDSDTPHLREKMLGR